MMVGVEDLLVAQDAPRNPCQLVGQGRGQFVAMKPWSCIQKPCSEAEALPIVRPHQNNVCSLDEQCSEILASALGDSAQDGSTACAVLAWHETKPRAKVSSAFECFACANCRDHSGRDQRADAGNAHEAPAVGLRLADLLDFASDGLDPVIEVYPVFVEANDQAAHPGRYLVLPVLHNCGQRVTQSPRSGPDRNALLDEESADLIDRCSPPRD